MLFGRVAAVSDEMENGWIYVYIYFFCAFIADTDIIMVDVATLFVATLHTINHTNLALKKI